MLDELEVAVRGPEERWKKKLGRPVHLSSRDQLGLYILSWFSHAFEAYLYEFLEYFIQLHLNTSIA